MLPPGDHKYVYGLVPPLTDKLIKPLVEPLQLTLLPLKLETVVGLLSGLGATSVLEFELVQPLASVTVNE